MKITEYILTENPCYKAGKKIKVKGIMLHSIGCPQPDAGVFLKNWDDPSHDNSCVHGFIDGNNGSIYKTLPWDHRGWHCGKSGNGTHIGIEMCEPGNIRYTKGSSFTCSDKETAVEVVKRTYASAVWLFAYLCKKYGLDPMADGVILSHREGYRRRIASNHGDPEHLWEGLGTGYTMDGFRRDVREAMEIDTEESDTEEKEEIREDEERVFVPYMVRVKIPNLNIRTGPGTDYLKTGKYTGAGTFTIVEEADGRGASKWGRLKSGAGWIALDYGERVAA